MVSLVFDRQGLHSVIGDREGSRQELVTDGDFISALGHIDARAGRRSAVHTSTGAARGRRASRAAWRESSAGLASAACADALPRATRGPNICTGTAACVGGRAAAN